MYICLYKLSEVELSGVLPERDNNRLLLIIYCLSW